MRQYFFSRRFEKSFYPLPKPIRTLFETKLPLFLKEIHPPSFQVKKIKGLRNPVIWEARLTIQYRWTFEIEKDGTIYFRNIGSHEIVDKESR